MSKIIGNTTTTPAPRSDWAQTDANKADFIKNKPDNLVFANDDATEYEIPEPEYVKYVAQSLTDAQKEQVRSNIDVPKGKFTCNPNLLDNWYFGNPVDQRGGYVVLPESPYYTFAWEQVGVTDKYYPVLLRRDAANNYDCEIEINGTRYVVPGNHTARGYTGDGYTIDRWSLWNGSLHIDGVGIVATTDTVYGAAFSQMIDPAIVKNLAGKTVTLSVLAGDEVGHITGNIHINGQWSDYWEIDANKLASKKYIVPSDAVSMNVVFGEGGVGAGTVKLIAAKLELGDTQTLAHQDSSGNWVLNEIPDYGEQLARCQRYFVKYPSTILPGIAISTSTALFGLPSSNMRAAPVISGDFAGTLSFANSVTQGFLSVISSISYSAYGNALLVSFNGNICNQWESCSVLLDNGFSLSADL